MTEDEIAEFWAEARGHLPSRLYAGLDSIRKAAEETDRLRALCARMREALAGLFLGADGLIWRCPICRGEGLGNLPLDRHGEGCSLAACIADETGMAAETWVQGRIEKAQEPLRSSLAEMRTALRVLPVFNRRELQNIEGYMDYALDELEEDPAHQDGWVILRKVKEAASNAMANPAAWIQELLDDETGQRADTWQANFIHPCEHERLVEAAIIKEREACARVADQQPPPSDPTFTWAQSCGVAIRSRGQEAQS